MMGRKRLTDPDRKKKEPDPFVPYDPRCEQCYYWRYLGGINDQPIMCCHYALYEGKIRDQISRTECGSFLDKQSAPNRKPSLQDIPMTQWGTGGLATIRNGER